MDLRVRVQPNARESGILRYLDGVLHVRVTEPAKDGKANTAVIHLLSRTFNLPKSLFILKNGHRSREKTLRILADSPEEIHLKLASFSS